MAKTKVKRSMGFTVDGQELMEQSGREIAEETFKGHGVECEITKIWSQGTDGGGWCFRVEVELDQANANEWDKLL